MADQYPDDVDGAVLRALAEDGNDLSQPMTVEFHIAAASEEAAERIAADVEKIGYDVTIDFDDGEYEDEADDEIIEPWTCTCQKQMILDYDSVMAAQAELDKIAKPHGGYSDGWGTFGNAPQS